MLTVVLLGIGVVVDGSYQSRPAIGAYLVDIPAFTDEILVKWLGARLGAYYSLPWLGPTRDTLINGDTATVVEKKTWGFELSLGYRGSWLYLGPVIGYGYRWNAVDRAYLNDTSFWFYGGVATVKIRRIYLEGGYHTGRGPFGGIGMKVYFPEDYE